jgi:DNA polymerase III epsilon subunit-like protein
MNATLSCRQDHGPPEIISHVMTGMPVVVIDLETTGFDPHEDRMVEIVVSPSLAGRLIAGHNVASDIAFLEA